jgi:hypothetical protein
MAYMGGGRFGTAKWRGSGEEFGLITSAGPHNCAISSIATHAGIASDSMTAKNVFTCSPGEARGLFRATIGGSRRYSRRCTKRAALQPTGVYGSRRVRLSEPFA